MNNYEDAAQKLADFIPTKIINFDALNYAVAQVWLKKMKNST